MVARRTRRTVAKRAGLPGWRELEREERTIVAARGTIAHVMQERNEPAKAFILFRGEYDKRRDEVTPRRAGRASAVSAGLSAEPARLRPVAPAARASAHRARDRQPPSGRRCSARGLVRTTGDFGVTGEMPSHPELLDWLAVEFRESGWDVKQLFKLMVTSATYRQSAAVDAREAGEGSGQPPAGARPAVPHGRRDGPRLRPGRQRPAGPQDRRARA